MSVTASQKHCRNPNGHSSELSLLWAVSPTTAVQDRAGAVVGTIGLVFPPVAILVPPAVPFKLDDRVSLGVTFDFSLPLTFKLPPLDIALVSSFVSLAPDSVGFAVVLAAVLGSAGGASVVLVTSSALFSRCKLCDLV